MPSVLPFFCVVGKSSPKVAGLIVPRGKGVKQPCIFSVIVDRTKKPSSDRAKEAASSHDEAVRRW